MGTAILFHPTKQQPEQVPDPYAERAANGSPRWSAAGDTR